MKKVHMTYFVHGTTTDNEHGISSGWSDVGLSELGKKQSIELKLLIKDKKFDIIFCSDLKRAVDSAKIAFENHSIIQDRRLRECNYGILNGAREEEVIYEEHITKPFPNGECLKDVEKRIRDFLDDLSNKYSGKNIAIVAHKAPQLALDVIVKEKIWNDAIRDDWRLKGKWQSGWEYRY